MPVIPIPLRPSDPDARLVLKAALDSAYEIGGYADFIYAGRPEPRLSPEDEARVIASNRGWGMEVPPD